MKDKGVHKAKSDKTPGWLVIPLCHNHHQGQEGIHRMGVHTWEAKYGLQSAFIDAIIARTGLNVWELEEEPKGRSKGKTSRPSKIIPRQQL